MLFVCSSSLSIDFSCRNLEYTCKEGGKCVVDVSRRNQCQACRFAKCLAANMRPEGKFSHHQNTIETCPSSTKNSSFLKQNKMSSLSILIHTFLSFGRIQKHLTPAAISQCVYSVFACRISCAGNEGTIERHSMWFGP